jgi:hypothetical protein
MVHHLALDRPKLDRDLAADIGRPGDRGLLHQHDATQRHPRQKRHDGNQQHQRAAGDGPLGHDRRGALLRRHNHGRFSDSHVSH